MSRIYAILGFLLSVLLLLWSTAWGWAHLQGQSVSRDLTNWSTQGWVAEDGQWHAALRRITRSLAVNPVDANNRLRLGRVHDWQAFQQRLWPELAAEQRRLALVNIAAALNLRPAWTEGWLAHASVGLAAGNDAAAGYALTQAIRTAPRSPLLHEAIAGVYVRWRSKLPIQTQTLLRDVLADGLKDSALHPSVQKGLRRAGWRGELPSAAAAP